MNSIAIGHLAIRYTLGWSSVPPIKIFFGDKQVIEGLATAFTNPAIESALIHCRALLEFLGLSAKDEKTLQLRKGSRKDDIVIEKFSGKNGALSKVDPKKALQSYQGCSIEAEEALAYVLHTTNKALAHSTHGFLKSEEASKLLEIAFRGIPILMVNNFYNKMELKAPSYEPNSRARHA
ncbi:MAG: hypothetical protein JKX92_15505 [Porticoccaceae bacterium]|nr:hypothetical protein [Porticoccaceae bacterium]